LKYSKIIGTGSYLPEKVVTNSDLAEGAAQQAMEAAGVDPEGIGLLVVGTTTPDLIFPSTDRVLSG
jgi:3-oxoacyl-[acyl-carrier-protein] synthase-3